MLFPAWCEGAPATRSLSGIPTPAQRHAACPPGGGLATGQLDSVCLVSGPDTAVQRQCAVHKPSLLPLVVPNKLLTILQGRSLKSTCVKSAQLPRDNELALPWFFTALGQESVIILCIRGWLGVLETAWGH
nr:unnamed protein product [Rangifer tarandus platyrhynchus]